MLSRLHDLNPHLVSPTDIVEFILDGSKSGTVIIALVQIRLYSAMSAILYILPYILPNDSPKIQTSDHRRIMLFDDCFIHVYITICFIVLFS